MKLPVVLTGLLLMSPGFAEKNAKLIFGSEYSCANGSVRFVIKSCKPVYTFETCEVQYLNSAAPNGLGAKIENRRDAMEKYVVGCTVAGAPVGAAEEQKGEPGQALRLGTWFDVRILGESGGKIHVRSTSGAEDWLDRSLVRRNTPSSSQPAFAGGSLPDGRYTCILWNRNQPITVGVVEIHGRTYRGPSNNLTGPFAPFSVSNNGDLTWSKGFGEFNRNGVHYQSAKIIGGDKPRFTVKYTQASGRAEGLECGRE